MNDAERVAEWVRFYKTSSLAYKMNALLATYESDGEKTLTSVLKSLGLTLSVDLVKDAAERTPRDKR